MAARRKPGALCLFCLLVAALLACAGLLLQSRVRTVYQYVVAAPEDVAQITILYEQAESTGAVISARRQHVHIGNGTITLYGVDAQWASIHHDTLYEGRMISERDVRRQTPCIVLSESTARSLFPSGDSLGETVVIDGCSFEVVGLIRDASFIGEADTAVAYIPITAGSVRMDTMMCSVPADAQSTPAAIYESQFLNWQSGGTFHNFARIKFSAWMPFNLTAVIVLAGLLWWGIRRYCTWCKMMFEYSVNELRTLYLHTLWPRFVLRGIIVSVLGAGVIVALWCWLKLLVYPMEVFSDWVPENPAKISSWISCIRRILDSVAEGEVRYSRETSIARISVVISQVAYSILASSAVLLQKKR